MFLVGPADLAFSSITSCGYCTSGSGRPGFCEKWLQHYVAL